MQYNVTTHANYEQPGHWIQVCPTNDDPNFQPQQKMKRTTGIPKSFIRSVENADEATKQNGQMMTDADGKTVIVVPDSATWAKVEAKMTASAAQKQEAADQSNNQELEELGIQCPLDKKLFVDPVKTPCCGTTYCNLCLDEALIESDLTCPKCETNPCIFEDAVADEDMIAKVRKYEEGRSAEKKAKEEAAKSPPSEVKESNEVAAAEAAKPAEPAKEKSPTPKPSSPAPSNASNSRKRAAEEELPHVRSPPKAPKSMLKQQQQELPAGLDATFIEAMSQYAPANLGMNEQQGVPRQAMFNPGMMGMMNMPMPGMMGMPGAMMNPMMNPMMNSMMNPMMNPMMMASMGNGLPNGAGFNMGFNANMNHMNHMNQGMNGFGGQQQQQQQQLNGWQQGGNTNNMGAGWVANNGQQFGGQGRGGGGNSAYARQPANPHRARGRQQRQAWNNDYNTL